MNSTAVPLVIDRRIPGAVENYRQNQELYRAAFAQRTTGSQAPAAPAAPVAPRAPVAPNAPTGTDQVTLSRGAEGPKSDTVKVDAWGKGKNCCLEGILTGKGYSLGEIYGKGADGKSLLDKVSAANNLRNPDLIMAGQELKIPVKEAANDNTPAATGDTRTTSAAGPQNAPQTRSAAQPQTRPQAAPQARPVANQTRVAPQPQGNRYLTGGTQIGDLTSKVGLLDKVKDGNSFNAIVDNKSPGRAGVQARNAQQRTADQLHALYNNAPGRTHQEKVSWVKRFVGANQNVDLDRLQSNLGSLSKVSGPGNWDAMVDNTSPGRAGLQARNAQQRTADQFESLYKFAPGNSHQEKMAWVRNFVQHSR